MKNHFRAVILSLALVGLTMPMVNGAAQRVPVPKGTRFVVRLNETISSKHSRVGDQFTATVVSPRVYQGATVFGHLSHLEKSGRLKGKTEIGLSFDRIQLRDGRNARLRAELLEVRQSESVKVIDEEGYIHSGSRGKQAIKRTSIWAAISGVVGGLIGGRKGVVVGLIIGAGASAGSLIIDGSKELKLERGTEMLIRTVRGDTTRDVLQP
ncbi:MAG: hypothetical protein AB1757_15010 [Acidobacteriota bacterium]